MAQDRIKIDCCIVGPPCSGKGTLAEQVESDLGVKIISTGAIYRAEMDSGSEFGQQVKEILKGGGICPDEMTNGLMDGVIPKESSPFGLDGYPRSMGQLDHVLEHYDVGLWVVMGASVQARRVASMNRGRWDDGALFDERERTHQTGAAPMVDRILQLPNALQFNTLEGVDFMFDVLDCIGSELIRIRVGQTA